MQAIGIGDLHFDGPLIRHILDLNERIAIEVNRVFTYARDNGIRNVFFYGDIFHRPDASRAGQRIFLRTIMSAPDLQMFIIAGNHDKEATHGTLASDPSLAMFETMQDFDMMKHARFVVHGPQLIRIGGERFNFLPWPHATVRSDCVNVMHVEAHGTTLDNGRKLENTEDSEHKLIDTDAQCVVGHLHTSQKVRNMHYSGTLYQTTFGESLPKFFHHLAVRDGQLKVKKVDHQPAFRLHNVVVKSQEDLDTIPAPCDSNSTEPAVVNNSQITDFVKLFIHKDVAMPVDLLERYPNVIRHNTFKTTKELEVLVREELRLDGVDIDLDEATWVKGWLHQSDADLLVKKRAYRLYNDLRTGVELRP